MDAIESLLKSASEARESAYAPYSNFAVGAALLADNGEIYKGCNVENVSFGLTVCAERVATFSAIAGGARKYLGIALIADSAKPPMPCGACLQVLYEFSPDMWVVSANINGDQQMNRLSELLPHAFSEELQ